jgi:DNA invertase Pin-like site-specific DNA recombinase
MAEKSGKGEGQVTAREKDSRADRLKSALRENLKRRKMQARERGKAGGAPSTGDKTSLHEDTEDDPDAQRMRRSGVTGGTRAVEWRPMADRETAAISSSDRRGRLRGWSRLFRP